VRRKADPGTAASVTLAFGLACPVRETGNPYRQGALIVFRPCTRCKPWATTGVVQQFRPASSKDTPWGMDTLTVPGHQCHAVALSAGLPGGRAKGSSFPKSPACNGETRSAPCPCLYTICWTPHRIRWPLSVMPWKSTAGSKLPARCLPTPMTTPARCPRAWRPRPAGWWTICSSCSRSWALAFPMWSKPGCTLAVSSGTTPLWIKPTPSIFRPANARRNRYGGKAALNRPA